MYLGYIFGYLSALNTQYYIMLIKVTNFNGQVTMILLFLLYLYVDFEVLF